MLKIRAGVVSLEQTDDRLRLPHRHVVVDDNLTPLQMILSVHDQGTAATIQNLPPNQVGGIAVAKLYPAPALLRIGDVVPIDWRVTGNDANRPIRVE
jgi:hypothetical protein